MLRVNMAHEPIFLFAQEVLGDPDEWHAAQHELGERRTLHKHTYGTLHYTTSMTTELASTHTHMHIYDRQRR